MTAVKRIELISIPVSDPDRAKAFYADTLGFELLADNAFGPGQRWIQLVPPGAETSITLTTWFDDYPPGTVRGNIIEVEDLAAAKTELEGRGLTFTDVDQVSPWGAFAPFADPDGNRWSLHERSRES